MGSPLGSIAPSNSLTIAPPNASTSVSVNGPDSSNGGMTISALTIGDPTKAPATATLNLGEGAALTVSNSVSITSNAILTTVPGSFAYLTAGSIGSGGTATFDGLTVTAANLNVFGGTTRFQSTVYPTTAALSNVAVSGGQLSMDAGADCQLTNVHVSGSGQFTLGGYTSTYKALASLNVSGTGGTGATIGSSTAVNLSGNANLTVNNGTVGPMTFGAGYSGLATLESGATAPAAVTVPAGVTGGVYLDNANTLTSVSVGSGTVRRTGDVTTVTQSGGSVTLTGGTTANLNQSGGSLGLTGNVTGTASVAGGSVVISPTAGGASADASQVPEPGTWILLAAGAACLLPLARRLRRGKEKAERRRST